MLSVILRVLGRLGRYLPRFLRAGRWVVVNVAPPALQLAAAGTTAAVGASTYIFGVATQVLPGIVAALVSLFGLFIYGFLLPIMGSIKGVLPRRWILWAGFFCLIAGPPSFYLVYKNKSYQAQVDLRKAESQKMRLARIANTTPFLCFL